MICVRFVVRGKYFNLFMNCNRRRNITSHSYPGITVIYLRKKRISYDATNLCFVRFQV